MEDDYSEEVTIRFKYPLPEGETRAQVLLRAHDLHSLLWEIDQEARSILKYTQNPSEDLVKFAEMIREELIPSWVHELYE